MDMLNVLNLLTIWRGQVPVKRIFWVWGIMGNIACEVFLRRIIPTLDLAHPRFTYGLCATGFYLFSILLINRGKNGHDIKFDTGDQQKARCVWAIIMFGFLLVAVNFGLSVSSILHRSPAINATGPSANI